MKFRSFLILVACIMVYSILSVALIPESVLAAPVISIYPRAGAPGTLVTVNGSNFTSYIGDRLSVFFNDIDITQTGISVPSSGSFEFSFEVPSDTSPGDCIVSIQSVIGSPLAEKVFTVVAPEVRLSTWGGTVSTELTINAYGFYVGKSVECKYYFDGETINIGNQVAGATGEFSLRFTIPEGPRGKHTIIASNEQGQRATAEFEIISTISIEPKNAGVGDFVTVSGRGFTEDSEIPISIHDQVVVVVQTTRYGSFDGEFSVPVLKAGTYLVAVRDVNQEVRWAEINITSRISLSKNTGEVGAKLTLCGTGYTVEGTVTISYDLQELLLAKADDIGSFTSNFTVPIGTSGIHIVTATDGVNLRQVTYTVEADAPAAPEPLTPKENAIVTLPVIIDWEGVYDVSQPLYYTLQVAQTADFDNIILERSGLIPSQYTLGNGTTLLPNRRGTYYFWRIRAVDGASNVGEWSDAAVFRIRPVDILPGWTRNVLIVLQVIIALFFAFLIWRAATIKQKRQ